MHNVSTVLIKEMKMATFTMRMDDDFKKEFSSVCKELGCNMSTVISKLPKHLLLQIFPKQKNGHHPQGGAHFLFDSFG